LHHNLSTYGKFSELEALTVLIQILDAMKYLHSKGLVHRDIKLDNILFQSKNRIDIKILDFGIAEMVGSIKNSAFRRSLVMGTPLYVAPEVLNGYCDFKSDIWSAGVIFYMLLTGQAPFSG